MEDLKGKLTFAVTLMVSATLCLSVLAMMTAFVLGLWAKEVDNAEIFKLLSPAFQTIIGGFIGLLAGVKLSHDDDKKHCKRGD
jgi:undecaprenyl pyrophosphate phosphatase UppP